MSAQPTLVGVKQLIDLQQMLSPFSSSSHVLRPCDEQGLALTQLSHTRHGLTKRWAKHCLHILDNTHLEAQQNITEPTIRGHQSGLSRSMDDVWQTMASTILQKHLERAGWDPIMENRLQSEQLWEKKKTAEPSINTSSIPYNSGLHCTF